MSEIAVQTEPLIRWMIRSDMPTVLGIEQRCFEFPWSEEDFIRCLRHRNIIGMVAELQDEPTGHSLVTGFMIYELLKNRLHILNIAVDLDFQRHGIGRAMIDKLIGKLSHQRRNRIELEVRETNLPAQKFFKQLGFRAVRVLREFYEDSNEDAYSMRYRVKGKVS